MPPLATDPTLYISGLLHIAPIYIAFESSWQKILDSPCASAMVGKSIDGTSIRGTPLDPNLPNSLHNRHEQLSPASGDPGTVSDRIHSMLEHLHLPGLMRSGRLKADIRAMTGWPDHVLEEQLESIGHGGRLGDFIRHIQRSVDNKPHALVAYSYILFMALFAGGRFIRASLESAGEEFWGTVSSPVKPSLHRCEPNPVCKDGVESADEINDRVNEQFHTSHTMPLRFFHFPTPVDGEDLKREFKSRLADSEKSLTAQEKRDIVQEAICIFESIILVVAQLDTVCLASERNMAVRDSLLSFASLLKNPLAARLRDSVVVTKERSARSSSKHSSTSEESAGTVIKSRGKRHDPLLVESDDIDEDIQRRSSSDIELCPAFSKSIRFERPTPPPRGHPIVQDGVVSGDLTSSLKMASRGLYNSQVVSWMWATALGALVVCILISGHQAIVAA